MTQGSYYDPLQGRPFRQRPTTEQRLSELERQYREMLSGMGRDFSVPLPPVYQHPGTPPPDYAQPPPPNPYSPIPLPLYIIPVYSAQEAWDFKSDKNWTDEKQWFINHPAGEIYCKWWDAKVPENVQQTYRLVPSQPPSAPVGESASEAAPPSITVEDLMKELQSLKEVVQSVAADLTSRLEVPTGTEDVSRTSKRNNGKGDAGGTSG